MQHTGLQQPLPIYKYEIRTNTARGMIHYYQVSFGSEKIPPDGEAYYSTENTEKDLNTGKQSDKYLAFLTENQNRNEGH